MDTGANMTRRDAVAKALEANSTAPNYWDPTESEYHEDTAKEGVPFLVLALITLISFLIFFIIRVVLCTCCGKGCCARNKRPVTTKVVLFNLLLCAVPICINFIGGALLMASASPVQNALNDFFDTTLYQLNLTRTEVKNVSSIVQKATPPGENVDFSQLTDAERQLDDAYADILETEKDARRYLDIIEDVIWVAGACAFALGLWGFVTLLGRRSPFMTIFLLLAAIFGPACWLLGGAGFATKELIDDACGSLERHVAGELNPWVLREARCGELLDAVETIEPLMTSANGAVREANTQLELADGFTPNDSIKTLCVPFTNSTGIWRANPVDEPEGCFALKQGEAAAEAEYSDNVCEQDLPEDDTSSPEFIACVASGRPIKRQQYQQILDAATAVEAVTRALPQINGLTRCEFIDRAFEQILKDDCPTVEHRFNRMTAAAVLSAIGITLASLYFCVCFRNLRHRRYKPGSDEDPEVNPEVKKGEADYNDSAHYTQG